MSLIGIGFIIWGEALTSIISQNTVHLEVVPTLLVICGATRVFFAASMIIRQALRGTGDTVWVFIITVVSSYGIRLPAGLVPGRVSRMGTSRHLDRALWGSWVCAPVFFTMRFVHGGWAKRAI